MAKKKGNKAKNKPKPRKSKETERNEMVGYKADVIRRYRKIFG